MRKQVIHTDKVPPARVPLSQAIKAGDWIFVSGQLGNDPRTMNPVPPGVKPPTTGAGLADPATRSGIEPETRQVCENLKAVLEAAGSSLDRVVKVTIYMVDLNELPQMNAVFSQYFPVDPPARTTFQCARLVADARVEIEAIAMA